MTDRTIARRYVRALFELALEGDAADGVLADLARIAERLAAEPELAVALGDPRGSKEARRSVLERLLPGDARPLSRDFAFLLADRRRQGALAIAHEEFAAMLREQRGQAVAEVASAAPLDARARAELVATLERITRKKITLQERQDPSLLGGVRVKVGSTLLDGSLQRRLAGMRDELKRVPLPRLETA